MANGDWIAAARWFTETADSQSAEYPNWYSLAVAWHALTANANAGNKIAARDLGDPWRWFRSESINTLAWHGAVSSAIAVDRLGRRDLADHLISRALRSER